MNELLPLFPFLFAHWEGVWFLVGGVLSLAVFCLVFYGWACGWNKRWPQCHRGLLALFALLALLPGGLYLHAQAAQTIYRKGARGEACLSIPRMHNGSVYNHLLSALEDIPPQTGKEEAARQLYTAYLTHLKENLKLKGHPLPFNDVQPNTMPDEARPLFEGIYSHRLPVQLNDWLKQQKRYEALHQEAAQDLAGQIFQQNQKALEAWRNASFWRGWLVWALLWLVICGVWAYRDIKKIYPYP